MWLCFEGFSPDYIFFPLMLEHIFFPTRLSFLLLLLLLLLLFRGRRTPLNMLSKTQKVKNVDMKLLPPHTILSTSRADSSSEIATLLYHRSYRFLDP